MKRSFAATIIRFLPALFVMALAWGAEGQKSVRELVRYIQDARKLGLKDGKIRKQALAAGWNQPTVNEAFTVVNYVGADGAVPPSGSAAPQARPAGQNVPDEYRIGAGDVLQIVVWKEPEASVPSVVVRVDGKVSLPLLRDVEVAGLRPDELEKVLVEKYSRLIRGAEVSVVVREIHSLKVYMVGAVRREGPVAMQGNITVLQALNEAGGVTEYARKKKIYILREENGNQVRIPFDYDAVLKGEHMESNIQLRANDTVVVPQ